MSTSSYCFRRLCISSAIALNISLPPEKVQSVFFIPDCQQIRDCHVLPADELNFISPKFRQSYRI